MKGLNLFPLSELLSTFSYHNQKALSCMCAMPREFTETHFLPSECSSLGVSASFCGSLWRKTRWCMTLACKIGVRLSGKTRESECQIKPEDLCHSWEFQMSWEKYEKSSHDRDTNRNLANFCRLAKCVQRIMYSKRIMYRQKWNASKLVRIHVRQE